MWGGRVGLGLVAHLARVAHLAPVANLTAVDSDSGGTTPNQGGATEAEGEGGTGGDDPGESASKGASSGCSVAVGADVGAWALLPALLWLSLRRRRRG